MGQDVTQCSVGFPFFELPFRRLVRGARSLRMPRTTLLLKVAGFTGARRRSACRKYKVVDGLRVVVDRVAACIRLAVPQATERQYIGVERLVRRSHSPPHSLKL
jgi:hypothetical protein